MDIPFHTVKMPEYEEWHRRGFELDPRALEWGMAERERERLDALEIGCVFRA